MPSANPTPHPLDAAARDELARTIAEALGRMERVLRDSFDADRDWTPELDAQVQAAHDALAALLAAVERGEAETARSPAVLLWAADAAVQTWQRGLPMETAMMDLDMALNGFRDPAEESPAFAAAARAHPPIQETDNG